jgi:hypothetical protein
MKGATHTIKYRYVCEYCGKQTDWISTEIQEDTESSGAAELLSAVVNKDRFKNQLQAFKEKVEGGKYDYNFMGGKACPSCGKRQSWLPATSQAILSPGKRLVIYPILYMVLGLIVLMIYGICRANYLLENIDGNIVLVIAFILLPAIGLFLAIRRNMINAKLDKALYADNTVRNKPEIDWNGI